MLRTLPDTRERAEQELLWQVTVGGLLRATKGFGAPEAERAYARARELCRQIGETQQLFWAQLGLSGVYMVRGEVRIARELSEQCLGLAQHLQDSKLLRWGHFDVGDILYWFGELGAARAHLEQSLALYDLDRDRAEAFKHRYDRGVASLSFLGRVLWHLGYPDQALKCSEQAIALANELSHPVSQAWALSWAAALHQLCREAPRARERAEAALTLATEQVIPFFGAHGMVLRGWALVEQGHGEEGMAQLRQGLTAYRTAGAELERSHWLGLLAEACANTGKGEEGLRALAEALTAIGRTNIRHYEPELQRLKGELLLKLDMPDGREAELCFQRALAIAQQQEAKSLELRAATSLARLLRTQGKHDDARGLLAPIYSWFTEGPDTADLRDAKALLDELSAPLS